MDIDGFDDLARAFRRFAEMLRDAADSADESIDDALLETALDVEAGAKRRAPVDTGTLRGDIRTRKARPGVYYTGNTVEYAPAMEYGSQPHLITPTDADALRFKVDGEVVFASRVNHPGTEAQPYLRPALAAVRKDLPENIAAELEDNFDR